MIELNVPIYLASKSPRRKKLLQQLGLKFTQILVSTDENLIENEKPHKTVIRLAKEKNDAALNRIRKGIIITADTIVVLKNEILNKPKNKAEAFKILKKLSGKTHIVYSGFGIRNLSNGKEIFDYEKTFVTFRKLTDKEIKDYINTGSPMDKAGAYGIQDDFGAVFISKINGCYYNVVGLSLAKFYSKFIQVL